MAPETAVVITTINSPCSGVEAWLGFANSTLIVVGDTKTPHQEWLEFTRPFEGRMLYFDCDSQDEIFPELSRALGWGTYARKNIGYLLASKLGFRNIFETDDDTFPRDFFLGVDDVSADLRATHSVSKTSNANFWDPYSHFAPESDLWARGTPLQRVWATKREDSSPVISVTSIPSHLTPTRAPNAVQFLVNNEPDLDAIFRLTKEKIVFDFPESREILLLEKGLLAPANTQATLFRSLSDVSDLYFPSTISLRIADILKMYVVQVRMPLSYGGFNTFQTRNPHDYFSDFILELEMYKNANRWVELLSAMAVGENSITQIYVSLVEEGFVPAEELELLRLYSAAALRFKV